jgi:ABC-type branched-subunit amino acid transport system ATPase component
MSDIAAASSADRLPAGAALLSVRGLGRKFGGLTAVQDLDLDVHAGAIMALIGPNGAGKSTTINLLTGYVRPTQGNVQLLGRDITGSRPDVVARQGMVRTFQHGRLSRRLSVLENVMLAGDARRASTLLGAVLRTPAFVRSERALAEEARALLAELGLAAEAGRRVDELPYGKQRAIEIARALISRPRVLLLDEPAAGLHSSEVAELADYLGRLRGRGIGVLLIEHNMGMVMRLADRITVLNFGQKIAEGSGDEVRNDPRVVEAYLGRKGRYAGV